MFRRISITRQFLLSLTSIVYYILYTTMKVNESRNCLVTDILLNIRKSKMVKLNSLTLRDL